jgi:hypothetical protein
LNPHEVILFFSSPKPNYGPDVDSTDNENWYQEASMEVKGGQRLRLTTSLLTLSRFSTKFGSLNVSQPYGVSVPVTTMAKNFSFTLFCWSLFYLHPEMFGFTAEHILGVHSSVVTIQDNSSYSLSKVTDHFTHANGKGTTKRH